MPSRSCRHASRRSRCGVLLALAAICCLPALPSAAAAEPLSPSSPLYSPSAPLVDENPYVTAEYSGTLTQESSATSPAEHHELTATLRWNTKVSGPVDQIEYTAAFGASAIHWQVTELSGTVKDNGENLSTKTPFSCEGSFSPSSGDGGTGGIELPLDEPGYPAGGGNPATNPDYRVAPPLGIPLSLLSSSAGESGYPYCATKYWDTAEGWLGGALEQPGWEGATGPVDYFLPGAPYTQPIDPPAYTCACGTGTTFKVTLTSTLKFTSPPLPAVPPTTGPVSGTGTGPPKAAPPPPIFCAAGAKVACKDKQAAQQAIRGDLKPATFQCELAGLGVAGIVAALAAPETGAAAFLAAEGVVGAEIGALSGTGCGLLLKQIYDEAKTVEDPAAGQLGKLAQPQLPRRAVIHPPSCSRFPKAAKFCRSLRAQVLAYANSLANGQAVAAALLTTVDRMTGAELGHNARALAGQAAHANRLRSQLLAQQKAQRLAGMAISRLLSGAHFRASISAAQTQAGLAAALSRLAPRGISSGALEKAAAFLLPEGSIGAAAGFGD